MTGKYVRLLLPQLGEVIAYAYLWTHEREGSREEARKDRPCAVVLTLTESNEVWVLPVTSRAPTLARDAIEIPAATRRRLGLREEPCWVVLTEANRFVWPGPDLRPVDRPAGLFCSYGILPGILFERIRDAVLARSRAKKLKTVQRTE